MEKHMEQIIGHLREKISLSASEAVFFTSLLEVRAVKRRDYVLQAGQVCQHQCFVVSGCLKVSYWDQAGLEHVIKFAPENWWTLDLESFELQNPAFYTIQAMEDTKLLMLSKRSYDVLLEKLPQFERFYRIMFQSSFIALSRRMTQNLSMKAEARYARFLEKYPSLQQRIPQKYIASYLGVTPEHFSYMKRKEMQDYFAKLSN
ncbi:Crp/Fnr family transcriptional regulator [Dyadobacter sp. CY326]|uniref:Crp/Fnr family transcriptional regulator n=1 Tax=Dyadobacter sp. CY326 TaxID=2907300 RepID=UPI001F30CE47|nr:Crp/Fnr family transcriptional regulator [Dyadobacter sp. CY326]MCE7066986.1 Crp/Fnr family transcriptional regulator [Dyadobacter sp. CY326]